MKIAPAASQVPHAIRIFYGRPVIVAVYALVLHWAYSELITGPFSYLGYRYAPADAEAHVVAWLLASAVSLALPVRIDRPSSVVLWVLYAVTVAPSILMSPYTSYLNMGEGVTMSSILAATFMAVSLAQRGNVAPLRWHVSPTSLWMVLGLFSAVTYILLTVTQGLNLEVLNLLDVYDVRADYVDGTRSVGALGYLVATQSNVVNPMIAARGYVHRRWGLVFVAVLGQILLYTTTGAKHILFGILAWVVIAVVLRARGAETRGSVLLIGASGLVVAAALIDSLTNTLLASSLFTRRFIYTPGVFTSIYVDFFSENPHAHLGHSILRAFVDYPYDVAPPYVIGAWMTGSANLAANANLFADGYSNFGYLGLVGAGAILLVYLRFVDRASVGLPIVMSAIAVVIPAVALSNASVLTSMLTHGLVATVVLLALVPRDAHTNREFGVLKRTESDGDSGYFLVPTTTMRSSETD